MNALQGSRNKSQFYIWWCTRTRVLQGVIVNYIIDIFIIWRRIKDFYKTAKRELVWFLFFINIVLFVVFLSYFFFVVVFPSARLHEVSA